MDPVWFHNGKKLDNQVLKRNLKFSSSGNIFLFSITKEDKGVYECEGYKGRDKFLAQSLLIVMGK